MIRDRYSRIPHPVQETKREGKANNKDFIKYKTTQAEGQEDSSFPVDGQHQVEDKQKVDREWQSSLTTAEALPWNGQWQINVSLNSPWGGG